MIFTASKDGFIISTDKAKLDSASIHQYLSVESYWSKNIPLNIVERSIEGSVCFGIYSNDQQIGFARLITDGATFGYLADVSCSIQNCRASGDGCWLPEMPMAYTNNLVLQLWKNQKQ
jgi:hypothetical protein